MLFLIQYDRSEGLLVSLRRFSDTARRKAEDTRLGLEIDLNRKAIDREVVLLEAPDEDALRRTHSRYFKNLAGVAESSTVSSAVRERHEPRR